MTTRLTPHQYWIYRPLAQVTNPAKSRDGVPWRIQPRAIHGAAFARRPSSPGPRISHRKPVRGTGTMTLDPSGAYRFLVRLVANVTRSSNQWTSLRKSSRWLQAAIPFASRAGTHFTVPCHIANPGPRDSSGIVRDRLTPRVAETNCDFSLAVSARLMPVTASPFARKSAETGQIS